MSARNPVFRPTNGARAPRRIRDFAPVVLIALALFGLVAIGLATIALEVWMIVEAALMFPRVKGVLEANALDAGTLEAAAAGEAGASAVAGAGVGMAGATGRLTGAASTGGG